jgi:hypothetical protein
VLDSDKNTNERLAVLSANVEVVLFVPGSGIIQEGTDTLVHFPLIFE